MSEPDGRGGGEDLADRVEAATAELARLTEEVAASRAALDELRLERDGRRKAQLVRITKRRTLLAAALMGVATLGFVGYLWVDRVGQETLRGQVVAIAGPAPVVQGDECRLQFEPAWFPFNAWLQVDCGRRRLYGYESYGHLHCEAADARVKRCEDGGPIAYDGDPHLLFDRPAGRVVIDDAERWRIEIALEPTR